MIKYRVYDTEDKEYLDSFRTAITPDGEVFVLSDYKYNDDGQEIWEAKLVCSARQEPGRFIIEQYIGLKDKNGVEIASGDIVKRRTANYEKQVFEDEYGVVKYEKGSFYVDFRGDEDNLMLRYGEPEVIGNIHENAELLEEK